MENKLIQRHSFPSLGGGPPGLPPAPRQAQHFPIWTCLSHFALKIRLLRDHRPAERFPSKVPSRLQGPARVVQRKTGPRDMASMREPSQARRWGRGGLPRIPVPTMRPLLSPKGLEEPQGAPGAQAPSRGFPLHPCRAKWHDWHKYIHISLYKYTHLQLYISFLLKTWQKFPRSLFHDTIENQQSHQFGRSHKCSFGLTFAKLT